MVPEEIVSNKDAIVDVFEDSGINDLPTEKKQEFFEDTLSVLNKYQQKKSTSSFEGVKPKPQAMTFDSIDTRGDISLAMLEETQGFALLRKLDKGLASPGFISGEVFNEQYWKDRAE